jgi:hypothetical protein
MSPENPIVPEVTCPSCGLPIVPPDVLSKRDRDLIFMLTAEFPTLWRSAMKLSDDNHAIALSQIVRVCRRLIEISTQGSGK